MCPSSGVWGGLGWRLDCGSQFTILSPLLFDGLQLRRPVSVCSSLHLLTRAHCVHCSASIPLTSASQVLAPAERRTESYDRALRLPVSHDRRRIGLSFLQGLYIKRFELDAEVAFYNRSVVTHNKVDLLKFPLRSSCSEHIDDAFVLLICFCFFHL